MPRRLMGTYDYKTEFIFGDRLTAKDVATRISAEMLKALRSQSLGVIKATA